MLFFKFIDCCSADGAAERDIYEDVQGTTQIVQQGADVPSSGLIPSSADTEEREAAAREAFMRNEEANRARAREAFIASRKGKERFPGEFESLYDDSEESSSDQAGPSLLLPPRGVYCYILGHFFMNIRHGHGYG